MDNSLDLTRKKLNKFDKLTEMANFFSNFKDPTRLKIIYALRNQKLCGNDLCDLLNITKSNLSHQLTILKLNKIVKWEKIGVKVFYTLDDEHVKQVFFFFFEHIEHKNKAESKS